MRRIALLLLLSLCATSTFGQVSRDRFAVSTSGQPVRNANVWVCSGNVQVLFGPIPPCQGPLATIYSDPGLTQQVTQPLHADANGNYLYYLAAGGTYTEVVTAPFFAGWSAVLTYACTPGSSCTWTQTQTFAVPIVSTVSTGTAPLSIGSTTVVPNLNAQLHNGKTAPTGNIVGDSDTQTLTNKTLTSPTVTNPSTTGADSGAETLTNKTFDISANTLKTATNTAGHYARNNGTQYVDATIAGADLPATTAPCTGVQLAIGLNAGGTSNCATPPTFVASGGSHAVGYVPDPGSSAGTTRFLREDATWQTVTGGVTEATWTTGTSTQSLNGSACQTTLSVYCSETVFTKAHTLVRITFIITTANSGCSPNVSVGVYDVTGAAVVSQVTVTGAANTFIDSGALSAATTAGHNFLLGVTTAGSGCSTFPTITNLTAVLQ